MKNGLFWKEVNGISNRKNQIWHITKNRKWELITSKCEISDTLKEYFNDLLNFRDDRKPE